jgi:hypothetical protein
MLADYEETKSYPCVAMRIAVISPTNLFREIQMNPTTFRVR